MEPSFDPDIELYPAETFKTLLDHEVNRSHRYGDPLTLLHLAFEMDPDNSETYYSAETFAINILNLRLRATDIPCKQDHEFLVLMPSTGEQGARIACGRLEKLFHLEHQSFDRVSFDLSTFIGMAILSENSSMSSQELLQNASEALQHARAHRLANAVAYSELKH